MELQNLAEVSRNEAIVFGHRLRLVDLDGAENQFAGVTMVNLAHPANRRVVDLSPSGDGVVRFEAYLRLLRRSRNLLS